MLNTNLVDAMKRRHETVRLSNLELLVAEAGSAAVLACLASTSESYLSQIRNQRTTPKGTPRSVGDDLAAKLEQAIGKPNGWMSHIGSSPRPKSLPRATLNPAPRLAACTR